VINPLRSEAEAFRFVLATLAYFAAIVLAALLGGRWAGFAVFLLLTAGVIAWWFRARRQEKPVQVTSTRPHVEGERRILVVANETVAGSTLRDELRRRSEGYREEVLVVCPALNSPIRHWASDEDSARASAQGRLDASLARLRELGIVARGEVGDGDPLQAMEDALRTFGADEIVISTHPEGRSHWLERGVVTKARERFGVPITHVVVDLEAEREEVREPS
jgi:membrane protein implicated in regulation of membrane protease activity